MDAGVILAVLVILTVAYVPAIAICKYCEPMSNKERVLMGAVALVLWPILVLGLIAASVGRIIHERSTKL